MTSPAAQGFKGMHKKVEKANQVEATIRATNITGDHYATTKLAHATAHATRLLTRTCGKCDSRERREVRYDGAAQDGRPGELKLLGECARRMAEKERERDKDE